MLEAKDFMIGVVLLGVSYAMIIIFGMTIPFLAELQFHRTPKATVDCLIKFVSFKGIATGFTKGGAYLITSCLTFILPISIR